MNSHTTNPDRDPDETEEDDDTERHAVNATSDDNDDGGDDAEGHRAYSSNVGANFD